MPRVETAVEKDARRSRARFGALMGIFLLAFGLFIFIPSTSMLSQSQSATGVIISHIETGSGRSARSSTTVEYNGNQYKSNQMHYRNARGLGNAQDPVKLSVSPNGGVEITKAIKKSQTIGIAFGLGGILFLTTGWFFGWKPYFDERNSSPSGYEGRHKK